MAQIINIAGTTPVEDPEYRYKMPRLVGKVEGRGNGIKTAIPNMVDVAASLHRPPGEVTKFFGTELGAQTTYVAETERAIVNGAHETRVLQDKLSLYIEKFVLCPSCKLPESSYKIKHEIINHNCAACGYRGPIDMQHKLTTYILKQHKQEKKDSKKGDKEKKDKKEKKSKDKDDDPDAKEKKKEKKEKKKDKKEKKAKKDKGSDDDDEAAAAASDDDGDDVEAGPLGSAIRGVRTFIETGKTPKETVSELRAVQTFCALPRNERGFILCAAAFDEDVLAQLPKRAELLKAFAKDATPYSLIGGLEKFCLVKAPAVAPKFALVLKALYDSDAVEEDDVLAWYGAGATGLDPDLHVSKDCDAAYRAKLLAAAEPFVKWLEEAEEDEETD